MSEPTMVDHRDASPSKSQRGLWAVVLLLVLGGASGVAYWWYEPESPIPEPPLPENLRDKDVLQAVQLARQAVLEDPNSGDAWGVLGMIFLAQLFDRDADFCFEQASRLSPNDPRWPYGRALIALKRDPVKAEPLLQQAMAAPSRPEFAQVARLELAAYLVEQRQLDRAEKLYREVQQSDPNNLRAAFGMGMIAKHREQPAKAIEWFTKAKASPHARKAARVQLASLARQVGNDALAEKYEKESALYHEDTAWPDPLMDLAAQIQVGHRGQKRLISELEEAGQYERAAQEYLEQLEDKPTAKAYIGAGVNFARIERFDRALELVRQGVALDPDSAQGQYTLALVLFTMSERTLAESPMSEEVRQRLEAVIVHAKRATELKADHAQAYLFWGLALRHLGKPLEALEPLKRGVTIQPDLLHLHLTLGDCLLDAGRKVEALPHFENARILAPNDPAVKRAFERYEQM